MYKLFLNIYRNERNKKEMRYKIRQAEGLFHEIVGRDEIDGDDGRREGMENGQK